MDHGIAARLAARIRREGPIPFDAYMEAALYDPDEGFFVSGGAGRAEGHFLTSPEVGSLFGALMARAVDAWWRDLGQPDPYVVVDAGAGRGQLARDVLRARPACAAALRYVMVERSRRLRECQREHLDVEPAEDALGPAMRMGKDDEPEPVAGVGPIVTALDGLPAGPVSGAVVANELLDNLPFRVVERGSDGWCEVRVGLGEGGGFVEMVVPAEPGLAREAEAVFAGVEVGTRGPVQTGIAEWLHACGRMLNRGLVAAIDHGAEAAEVAARGPDGWVRTYRGHERGGSPLEAPGTQDITADVVLETLRQCARHEGFDVVEETTQAHWLRRLGIAELVDEGRETWRERAHLGDLEALRGRSYVTEAEALLDPLGLGAHRVVILAKAV